MGQKGTPPGVGEHWMASRISLLCLGLHASGDGALTLTHASFPPETSLKLQRWQLQFPRSSPPVTGRQSPGVRGSHVASFSSLAVHARAHP